MKVKSLSRVQLFATPWTVSYHTPPSMGFSRQEYLSGLPFPSLGGQKPKGRKNEKEISSAIMKKMMRRQRNTIQMKKQTRNTGVQINEKEIGKLPEKEFRIVIGKMVKNLESKVEKMQSINKNLEELKNKHTKTNNTITEIKNTLE